MKPKPGCGLIALCVIAALVMPLNLAADQVVSFSDSNLESAVRQAIGKPTGTIDASDLQGLVELQATALGISDLTGIQHCTDLQRLWLGGNQIAGLQPLAALAALRHLFLSDNQISSVQPLSGLSNLSVLDLAYNHIGNIEPLASLTTLHELGLEHNQVADLQPLAGLANLRILGLSFNPISGLQPLAGLSGLEYLSLWSTQVSSLDPLAGLSNLHFLDASGNYISDLHPLAGLGALRYLYLSENDISHLSPLAGLLSLDQLDLARNLVTDLGALVANSGLGAGDVVILNENWLVLGADTRAAEDVQLLRNRGVKVWCNNQVAPQPPSAPVGLTATVNAAGHVDLTWTDVSHDEEGFRIQRRRQNPDGSWPEQWTAVATLPANRHAHTDDTLTVQGNYQYRVGAFSHIGASYWATSYSLSVTPPIPGPPSHVTVWSVQDDSALRVTWRDNSSNETSFKVERRRWLPAGTWSAWELRLWTGPGFTAFTDDQIPVGSSYQYRVRAVNHVGPSDWAVSIGVRCEPTPLWPVDLAATQTDAAEGVQLTWRDKSIRETGFKMQRRMQNPDGSWQEWTTVAWLGADTESWTDLSIAQRGTYEYRLRAHNATGPSEWAPSATLWASPRTPRPPGNVGVQAVNDSTAIRVTWQDNSDNETSFKVERRRWLPTETWSDWEIRLWTAPNLTGFIDDQIPVGSSYQYRVRAVNAHGPSDWAVSIGVRCEPTPLWPVDLRAEGRNFGADILVTWRSKSDRETYLKVERRRQLGQLEVWSDWQTIVWLGGGVEQYLDGNVPGDGKYQYRVRVFNQTGPSEYSLPVTVWRLAVTPAALSVMGMTARQIGETVSVSYSLTASAEVTMEVRNIAGRLVSTMPLGRIEAGMHTATWNLRNTAGAPVPSGLYLCTLTARGDDGSQARLTGSVSVQR